jgi:hypothetical protein
MYAVSIGKKVISGKSSTERRISLTQNKPFFYLALRLRLIYSLKLFFDVVVEFEFIGARRSATTRSILFPHAGQAPRSTSKSNFLETKIQNKCACYSNHKEQHFQSDYRKCHLKNKKKTEN